MSTHTAENLRLRLILLLCLATSVVSAQEQDTLSRDLPNVSVSGRRVNTYLQTVRGASVVSMEMMRQMPRILGNADPIHYAMMLPGVQTNSEYDAGLHIQGCDNSHNMVSIGGVPIYNASHLLGFFSVFNATHYSDMRLDKSAGVFVGRLGGSLDMRSADTLVTTWGGDLSVGPMSSQGTLRVPLTPKSDLILSARAAYLNLLYSRWLTIDDQQLRYSFCDYNLTYTFRTDPRNTVTAEAYFGGDRVGVKDAAYTMDSRLRWSNFMGAVRWRHASDGAVLEQSAWHTAYRNRFRLTQTNIAVSLPSDISTTGYRAQLTLGRTIVGAEAAVHAILPQTPQTDGLIMRNSAEQRRLHPVELSASVTHTLAVGRRLEVTPGLRLGMFSSGSEEPSAPVKTFFSADPYVSATLHIMRSSTLTFAAAVKHQNLFKTGFSQLGLPTEFWIPAGAGRRPQYSYDLSLLFETVSSGRMWRLSAEVYHKWLRHQLEYDGNVFDFIFSEYNLADALLHGRGTNYGVNIMLEKRKGRLTGWLSYSVGRAWRRFPGTKYTGKYPASHERIHELNAVATFRLARRWSIGATMVAASGTPYTAPERFYLINNNIITEFGEHNGCRIGTYARLDLSASYDFSVRGRRRSGINVSLYNVTMHNNELFRRLKIYKDRFANKPFSFVLNIMPSVNYYYSF